MIRDIQFQKAVQEAKARAAADDVAGAAHDLGAALAILAGNLDTAFDAINSRLEDIEKRLR